MSCSGSYVLIVDDDEGIREILEYTIDDLGHPVKATADGAAALALLLSSPRPSLILLDFMMPRMDAAEFMEQKQRHPALEGIPVYLMTASAPKDFFLPGIVSILRKPFHLDELLTIVERHC